MQGYPNEVSAAAKQEVSMVACVHVLQHLIYRVPAKGVGADNWGSEAQLKDEDAGCKDDEFRG